MLKIKGMLFIHSAVQFTTFPQRQELVAMFSQSTFELKANILQVSVDTGKKYLAIADFSTSGDIDKCEKSLKLFMICLMCVCVS